MVLWTAGFVLLTLVINAPMLPYVLRWTGLNKGAVLDPVQFACVRPLETLDRCLICPWLCSNRHVALRAGGVQNEAVLGTCDARASYTKRARLLRPRLRACAVPDLKMRMRRKAVRALASHTGNAIRDLRNDEDEMLRGAPPCSAL